MMRVLIFIAMLLFGYRTESINELDDILAGDNETFSSVPTRRILEGTEVGETRPYMVYLRLAPNVAQKLLDTHWLCGGVIIHKRYILTSAACIEDAKHFYVISGTHTWVPPEVTDNECINNGAKRAVWKCMPTSYFFDGDNFDNIRWMVGDIAIVKVEDDFNFERRIRGCDFIPNKVDYNNQSQLLEKSGTFASIAGWGTTDKFVDVDYTAPLRSSANSVQLLETDVMVISKTSCKKRWDERYHFIISDEMICTKDSADNEHMGTACMDREVNCKELELTAEEYYDDSDKDPAAPRTRMIIDPRELQVHTAAHRDARRKNHLKFGGFCENDHGGPLIVGRGKSSMVIGIMSACHTEELTMKCYGPYLFTSVFKYRDLISCAIEKNSIEPMCRKFLSTTKTHIKETALNWPEYPERPALRSNGEKLDVPPVSDEMPLPLSDEMPSPPSDEILSPPPRQSPPSPKPPPPPTQRSLPSRKPPPPPTQRSPPSQNLLPPRRTTTTRPSPPSTTAPPNSLEQEFRQNANKKQEQNVDKPAKKIDTSERLSGLQRKVPTWLTDINPPDEIQSKPKLRTAVSDETDNFSAIKRVIMRRFFNQMHVEK